jgi:hypothetical protein
MDLDTFRRLLSPEGQRVLRAATELQPTASSLLSCHQRLRKQFPDDLVKAAVETVLLRVKAAGKFTRADRMYFTREALEQSSGEVISGYRARRFEPYQKVGDFCCGIGGDVIGLAGVSQITAVDADPLRLAMAEENLRVYERRDRAGFLNGDLLTTPLPDLRAAFFDPDRRADGRRHIRIREYEPPVAAVMQRFPIPLGIKVAGELKECVLWLGELKTNRRRATVLPVGATLAAAEVAEPEEAGPLLTFLYDPDPAVVRSGLIADLGPVLAARPIDPDIAYLTSDRYEPTPFATGYSIEDSMPFHARRVGDRLRSLHVGPVTITKRGSAVDVDELRRSWKLQGNETRTVILTRVLGKPFALIARRL